MLLLPALAAVSVENAWRSPPIAHNQSHSVVRQRGGQLENEDKNMSQEGAERERERQHCFADTKARKGKAQVPHIPMWHQIRSSHHNVHRFMTYVCQDRSSLKDVCVGIVRRVDEHTKTELKQELKGTIDDRSGITCHACRETRTLYVCV